MTDTSETAQTWRYNSRPTEPGWYPVVRNWGVPEEGSWPGTAFWEASRGWGDDERTVVAHGPCFSSQEDAKTWVYQHDDEI